MNRREFLAAAAAPLWAAPARRPNVIVVMTDDQGYGDLSIHGNPDLATPNMDRVAREGAQCTQFQVCPVCSPTRSSLMTGRYNYRTGVVDTFLGRSMMDPAEVTVAEILRGAGYRTGIFGKWHLGDNYPLRAMDQGFAESLVIRGGGLRQPGDPPPGQPYFDPVLSRNGRLEPSKGYCTDIFFREAMIFIERHRAEPFFVYLPTNAPHTPLEIEETYVRPFRDRGLEETTAKVYGMVKNLDDNLGRLHAHLERLNLVNDTILIFLTDNGPQQKRYNAGMRGLKGTVYQGGIRVPFFVRWPGQIRPGTKVDRIAAHIDLAPTVLEATGVPAPEALRFDGVSLLASLRGQAGSVPDRTLFTQWHRGDAPELFRAHAARTQRWKLVNGRELYDLAADPAESRDVAAAHPEVVARLRQQSEEWFASVSASRHGYEPPRIVLGAPEEPESLLTRQDWRGPRANWAADGIGYWEVDVRGPAEYQIELLIPPAAADGEATVTLGGWTGRAPIARGATTVKLPAAPLPAGPGRLAPVLRIDGVERGVLYVTVKRIS